jgi:hypothetical protein
MELSARAKECRDFNISLYEMRKNYKSTHHGISSFDEVVKVYESIKPIRGRLTDLRHTDRRPLNSRWKWWERVIKFDDNTYGLGDGHEWWWGSKEQVIQTLPILWERKDDGEYITIRNHFHKHQISWTRFDFLGHYLPKGITFWYNKSGKHFINHEGEDYALPKSVSNVKWGTTGTMDVIQDNKIVYKRDGDKFIRVNNLLPVATKRKGEVAYDYQDKILKFWEWANAMLPVLGDSLTFEGLSVYSDTMTDGKSSIWYWHQATNYKEVLDILDDEEHPKKMALAVCVAYATSSIATGKHFQVESKSRQKFIEVIRKVGNMYDVDYK